MLTGFVVIFPHLGECRKIGHYGFLFPTAMPHRMQQFAIPLLSGD
jgi:hypothetical protein